MNNKEFVLYEKAFESFLMKLPRKKEVEIEYVEYSGKALVYDMSFVGYETTDHGLHGIHYHKQKNKFYFGTLNVGIPSLLIALAPGQEFKIPSILKKAFLDVAESKRCFVIRKDKWKPDINVNLVSR